MTDTYTIITILGMAAVTIVTRGFFLLPRREWPMPRWVLQGLRYAPLAALLAIAAPETVLADGELAATWSDPRLLAVAAGSLWFVWRRGILGTIVVGTAVLLAFELGFGL